MRDLFPQDEAVQAMDLDRLERLVHETLAHPEEARSGFLDDACGDDLILRREVESLLRYQKNATEFFETSAFEWTGPLSFVRQEPVSRPDENLNARIGPYRLVERIGSGGMGEVYKANRDDHAFEHTVAIKLVRRGMDSEEIVQRFRQERQLLAGLVHPAIARLLEGGTSPEGLPYLVMEHVDGQRIDAWCDDLRLSIDDRIRLFLEVCSAVQYAHRNLVVHRDLKPGNILVTADGTPKLLDFGIAKVLSPGGTSIESTLTGDRRHTPAYASPEQVRGESITTATDVYSLGVVLYGLLTGRRPYRFSADTPAEAERAICDTPPSRPHVAVTSTDSDSAESQAATSPTAQEIARRRSTDLGTLRRRLSGDLEHILLTALRKEPERRYPSAEALAGDLQRYLEGLPISARPDSAAYRMRRFIARHRVGVVASVFVAVALLAATAVSLLMLVQARRAEALAAQEIRTATAINVFLTDMLASIDPRAEGADVTVR